MVFLDDPSVCDLTSQPRHLGNDETRSPVHEYLDSSDYDSTSDSDDSEQAVAFCFSIVIARPSSSFDQPSRDNSPDRRSIEYQDGPSRRESNPRLDQLLGNRFELELDMSFNRSTSMIKPRRIGYFSVKINPRTNKEMYYPDKSQLRYLSIKQKVMKVNLLEKYNPRTFWSRSPNELQILRWYTDNKSEFIYDETLSELEPDFITDFRTLTSIMTTIYETRNDWEIVGIKIGDKIVLHEVDSDSRKHSVAHQPDDQNQSSYAGYNFEAKVTRRFDGHKCRPYYGGLRDSFHSVSVVKVGQHKIVYNSRCSAVKNKFQMDRSINEMEFVEIKTRFHSRSWFSRLSGVWARALLNDVNHTIVGRRDENFNLDLDKVGWYRTTKIPAERHGWSPKTMVDCLESTLNLVKTQVTKSNVVYRFYHPPGKTIFYRQSDEPVGKFIPSWFNGAVE